MKKTLTLLTLAAAFMTTAAYAQSTGEKTGINSTLGIAPTTADFIKEAAMSDMLEIAAAKVAEQKGDAQEKTFAAQMITDHTKTTSELKGLVSGNEKDALDAMRHAMEDGAPAKEADFAFHRDALRVCRFHYFARYFHVVFEAGGRFAISHQRSIHHHAGEAHVNGALARFVAVAVIKMQHRGNFGINFGGRDH